MKGATATATDLTTRVKELGHSLADFVGISPAERLKYAPVGHRPSDILPGAESVISIGIRMLRGAYLQAKRGDLSGLDVIRAGGIYARFNYNLINLEILDTAAIQLCRLLEQEGFLALAEIHTGLAAYEDRPGMVPGPWASISHRHAAVASGLGELGWSGLVINPEVGSKARYITIITDAKLTPDPMYNGPRLCEPEECGYRCARICPGECLSDTEASPCIIGEQEFNIGYMEHLRCIAYSNVLAQRLAGIANAQMPDNTRPLDLQLSRKCMKKVTYKAWAKMPYGMSADGGLCLLICPVQTPPLVKKIRRQFGGFKR
ncbi:hypothetical protein ACFLU4_00300 [Chloroflexota bacterium]